MGSLKRKIVRQRAKRAKKDLKEQMMLFDKLGNKCDACEKDFDKKSKECVTTWKVVVREKEKVVRLYCPECWDKAIKIIKEVENDLRIQDEGPCARTDKSQS